MVYFERQRSALCAVHTVNNLLQAHVFNEIQFAEFAAAVTNSGISTTEDHVSLAGDFSTDVIAQALDVFGLWLVHLDSSNPEAVMISSDVNKANGYILNKANQHWLALRRVNNQWYELDSLKQNALTISPLMLELTIHEYKSRHYAVFIVCGEFPDQHTLQFYDSEPPTSSDSEYENSEDERERERQSRLVEEEEQQLAIALSQSLVER
ncbi:hypothetical protein P9112_009664 [Eukaryota sp. TZLM1-RC]